MNYLDIIIVLNTMNTETKIIILELITIIIEILAFIYVNHITK